MAPHSPDHNPLDLILWGFMKGEIHRTQPGSNAEVKQLIREFLSSISKDLLQRVTRQFISRVRRYIDARGGVFKKLCEEKKLLLVFRMILFEGSATKIEKKIISFLKKDFFWDILLIVQS